MACGEIIRTIPPPAIYVTSGSPSQILAFSSGAPGSPSPLNTVALPAGAVAGYIAGDPSGNLLSPLFHPRRLGHRERTPRPDRRPQIGRASCLLIAWLS